MPREFEESSVSIVLLGNFNPSIFSPAWFGRYGLLTEEEQSAVNVKVIHSEMTVLELDWLVLQVEQNRFSATSRISPVQIRDLVLKTFMDYLPHTPIHALGINRTVIYKLPSFEHRMRLGRAMAPLEPWGEWGTEIAKLDKEGAAKRGGLVSLTMQQPRSEPLGHFQVTMQPTEKVPRGLGVAFQVNDHYEVLSREKLTGCEYVMEQLDRRFEASLNKAEEVVDQVLKSVEV